jgi:hypothetical protein
MYAVKNPKTAHSSTMINDSRTDPFAIILEHEFTCIVATTKKKN